MPKRFITAAGTSRWLLTLAVISLIGPSSVDTAGLTIMGARVDATSRNLFSPLDFAAMEDIGWEVLDLTPPVRASHRYADNGNFLQQVILTGSTGGTRSFEIGATSVTNVGPHLDRGGQYLRNRRASDHDYRYRIAH